VTPWTQRKLAGFCTYAGCGVRLPDDAVNCRCPAHRADHNRRQRASKRQRARAEAAQLVMPVVYLE
jgi:hypothetical protein